jgi:hypothetical protein
MPNHIHLVLMPQTAEGLARAIGETHRQYTGFVNARARWTGHRPFLDNYRLSPHLKRVNGSGFLDRRWVSVNAGTLRFSGEDFQPKAVYLALGAAHGSADPA